MNERKAGCDNLKAGILMWMALAVMGVANPLPAQTGPLAIAQGASQVAAAAAAAAKLAADLPQPAAAATTAAAAQTGAPQIRPILLQNVMNGSNAGANFRSATLDEQTTHITTGRSILIDTKQRLARVYITNPEILDSYTASPNQVVLTAKKAGTSTLILWDETGESKSYLVSSDLNVEMLRESLKEALPNETIHVQGNEGRVVLSGMVGSSATAEAAVKLASIYSKDVSNSLVINTSKAKQVRLEVKIVEVDRSKLNQFGFNFFSAGGQNPATTSTEQYPSNIQVTPATPSAPKTVTVTNPLNFSLYSSRLNIGATLQDLETMQVAQILAEPNITAMSGEKANFLAGGEFPFPVVQGSSTGGTSVSISFRPYGVRLEFTPIVNNDGTIDLKVAPEVSALDYTNSVNIAGYTIPAISTRKAETEVVLRSGQTFGLTGLLDKRTTDLYAKTPGVASIPILGQLFRSKNVNHTNSELVVIVTPIIVDPVNEPVPIPADPQRVVPLLDKDKFDQGMPKGAKK